jgi:hypothetical protein
MIIIQAIVIAIVNYDRNTFTVQATAECLVRMKSVNTMIILFVRCLCYARQDHTQ